MLSIEVSHLMSYVSKYYSTHEHLGKEAGINNLLEATDILIRCGRFNRAIDHIETCFYYYICDATKKNICSDCLFDIGFMCMSLGNTYLSKCGKMLDLFVDYDLYESYEYNFLSELFGAHIKKNEALFSKTLGKYSEYVNLKYWQFCLIPKIINYYRFC